MATHRDLPSHHHCPHPTHVSTLGATLTREGDTCGACGTTQPRGADPASHVITLTDRESDLSEVAESPVVIHTIPEAIEILRIGRSHFYDLISAGELRTFKIGSRRLVTRDDLLAFIDRQLEAAR